jgi:hypothetical protein
MIRINFLLAVVLLSALGIAQTNTAVRPGETLVFDASYNMSGLGTNLAEVTLSTETVKTSKSTLMHLRCSAATFTKWDSFFKIRDLYESYVNPNTLAPSLYKRNISEGGYEKEEKYVYLPSTKKINTTKIRKGKKEEGTITYKNGIDDVVTTLYKIRNADFGKMKVGESKSFSILFDAKEIPVSIKYLGKETVKAGPLGNKTCYKMSISAATDKLKGKDKNLVWFTADERKIPVMMRFSIPVGTGELTLKKATDNSK